MQNMKNEELLENISIGDIGVIEQLVLRIEVGCCCRIKYALAIRFIVDVIVLLRLLPVVFRPLAFSKKRIWAP